MRGILNKLTPEKFEKLINDVLNIGLDSSTVLKGVIVLVRYSFWHISFCVFKAKNIHLKLCVCFQIFEKALDEPKYSSMYAQLCRFLVEKAPNFEPSDSTACTFKKLLLKKCRDEFENRAQISQQYEKMAAGNGGLNTDEEDAKYLAKRKMLGNVKFMGTNFSIIRIFEFFD